MSALTGIGGVKIFLTIGIPGPVIKDGVGATVFVRLVSGASDGLVRNTEVQINL